MDYQEIRQVAKEEGCRIPDLLALAPQNDPFNAGSKNDLAKAEWFAQMWKEQGYTTGVHLRRVHYRLSSLEEDVFRHDGLPYENTDECWSYLNAAGRYARHLKLVPPEAFVDRRNPEPHVHLDPEEGESVGWDYFFDEWEMPKIETDLSGSMEWEMPSFFPLGLDYRPNLQPYHLEVWAEKTTMNDELIPLCESYGVNLVTGAGFLSITTVAELLRRMDVLQKPCRILYVSDYDPAGMQMPVSAARQIEYRIRRDFPEADIKLDVAVVTEDQIAKYALPRKPIKDKDKRKANFEATHGTGAVELDALEALHPGELVQILEERISVFWDRTLAQKVVETNREARRRLREAHERHLGAYEEELEELRDETQSVVESYRSRLVELSEAMRAELAPYQERLESLHHAIEAELGVAEVDMPDLPEEKTVSEGDGWLFDGGRDYFTQLAFYKQHQKK